MARRETLHTVSLVAQHLERGMSVLDVGCGEGYVGEELAARGAGEVHGVDIVDIRRLRGIGFSLYDGVHLAFPDERFDVVMLNFVLHHVPDERKIELVREALRVARAKVFIVEDTPATAFDRFMSQRHGEDYRRRIESDAGFGFLTAGEWRWLFRGMGLEPESRELPRFARSPFQPYARTAFVLRKPPRPDQSARAADAVRRDSGVAQSGAAVGPGKPPRSDGSGRAAHGVEGDGDLAAGGDAVGLRPGTSHAA
jgi:SAM-dependent methyltransferase